MMSVLAFLCRMLVFEVLSLLSTTAARGYELSLFERVIVSTVQVLVFAGCWMLFNAICFLLVALQEGRFYRGVHERELERELELGMELGTEEEGRNLSGEALQEATGLTDEELAETLEEETVRSTTTHATDRSKTIVFTSRRRLREHVTFVYVLGMVLWLTVYCFDYTLLGVNFFFIVGLYSAWCVSLVWRSGSSMGASCLQAAYVLLIAALLSAYFNAHHETLLPEGKPVTREVLVSVVVPVLAGAFWMHTKPRDLVRSVGDSFFTCVLLCLPVLASVGVEPVRKLWQEASSMVLLWLFVLEPLLKALGIYVIALTLQTGRRAELLVTLSLAVQLDDVLFFDVPYELRVVTGLLMGVTIVLHLLSLVAAEAV